MSILSVAAHRLLGGDDPSKVWTDTKAKIESWGNGIVAKVPASLQPLVAAAISDVKQGASDLVGQVGDALPGILADVTPVIDDLFATAATTYLGPALGKGLSAAEADGLNRLESRLISQIKSAKLSHMAAMTGASAPPAPAALSPPPPPP